MRYFAVLIVAVMGVACDTDPEINIEIATQAEQQLQRIPYAMDFIASGEYGSAINVLTEISAALPDSSDATTMAAFLGMRNAADYRRIHASVHNNLGLALFRSRRFDAATKMRT